MRDRCGCFLVKPRRVLTASAGAVLAETELAVLDAEDEDVPSGLGEMQLAAVRVGRVVHYVQRALAGFVRSGARVSGNDDLDAALPALPARFGRPSTGWQPAFAACIPARKGIKESLPGCPPVRLAARVLYDAYAHEPATTPRAWHARQGSSPR